jgi:hypothetical protein
MSSPTVTSIATDEVMDRAMGFGRATSGGRGQRKYENQMSRRDMERLEVERKKEALTKTAETKKTSQKISEIKRAMEAGELDYM